MIKIKYRSTPEKIPDKIVCNYLKDDYEKMKKMLNINWKDYFKDCGDNVDQVWEKFVKKYHEADKECVPRKIVKTRIRTFSYKLDRKTLSKRKRKYRLWKRYMDTKDGKVYADYCRCRNQVRRSTRKAWKIHEQNIAGNAKNNPKSFWRYIKSKTKMRSAIPELYATCLLYTSDAADE